MKVFKFGGASVNSVDRIHQLGHIVSENNGSPLFIVVSAIGKTTNALEKVTDAFFEGRQEEALNLFHVIKQNHLTTAKYLLVQQANAADTALANFFTEIEWLLHDKPVREYNYYYDQIVCVGELMSTCIISFYLKEAGIDNTWLDVRDILRTDNHFRAANIDEAYTNKQLEALVKPALQNNSIVVTQGFIGATDENESTTLGREGSDYSAAIFANLLNAETLTIWKDVEGVMNADPKQFPDATILPELNYREVIEMAYYGAQVIHPKTIKPLENKEIPLLVKCFLNMDLPGTVISRKSTPALPPIIVLKQDQVLLQLNSKDFSFVGEKPIAAFYEILAELQLKPNITQNGAISFICCLDDTREVIEKLAHRAGDLFNVQMEKNLTLLTVRHYNAFTVQQLTTQKDIVLKQETKETIQVLWRNN